MMNKRNNSKELNKCIRGLFDEGIDKFYERVNNGGFVNCFRYNNELCNGYKIVWKSYGWATDDNSITTKIYKKDGNEFLTTYQIGKKFVYDSGKL